MGNKKTVIIGILVLTLAVTLVLLCVCLPMLTARKEMRRALHALCDRSAQYLLLRDPLRKTDDYLGNDGKEIVLNDGQAAELRAQLSELSEQYSYQARHKLALGAWELHVLAKQADGTVACVYFTPDSFYCTKGDAALVFTPDDTAAYAALYTKLQAMMQ